MFEWWWEFLYSISRAINQCIDALFKLFLFFAGASNADINSELTGSASGNILKTVFSTNTVAIWFAGFFLLSVLVFGVSIIIGLIRTEWVGKDNKEGKVKIFKSSLKGALMVALMPAIFGIAIRAATILLGGLVGAMSGTSTTADSFAQQLFDICMPGTNQCPWDSSYGTLVGFLNAENLQNSTNLSMHDYNFFIAYIGGIIMLFVLGLSVLNLIERIIDLVFLYIISPVVVAVSPLDEGNRLGIWKDLTIAKFLSISGMVICFYIYFLFMNIVNNLLLDNGSFLIGFAKLLCAIGGALAARKGGLLISNLVGHNTALIEGQQQGLAAQAIGTGFRAGLGVIGALGHASLGLLGLAGHGIGAAARGVGNRFINSVESAAGAATGAEGSSNPARLMLNAPTTFQNAAAAYLTLHPSGGGGVGSINEPISLPIQRPPQVINLPWNTPLLPAPQSPHTPQPGNGEQMMPEQGQMPNTQPLLTMPPAEQNVQNIIKNASGFSSSEEDKK